MQFSSNAIFTYNLKKKRLFLATTIATFTGIAVLILLYIMFLQHIPFFSGISTITSHIFSQIKDTTLLGSLYISTFGGLFFVFLPIEAVFLTFVKNYNPFLITAIFISGFIISYTINYFIGSKLANLSKKIITPKKFYKMKGILNRYGAWAIFGFNALPLPSQPLATILGVFKYNKKRFYLLFITGQLAKLIVISIAYIYFKKVII